MERDEAYDADGRYSQRLALPLIGAEHSCIDNGMTT